MFSLSTPDAPGHITLLGSVHAGLRRFYPLPEPVEAAFDDAARLLVELDARAQAGAIRSATAAAALLPDGGTIDQVLRASTMAAIAEASLVGFVSSSEMFSFPKAFSMRGNFICYV
jgi:uncharacterized protein YbaP (TraB family)